MNRVCMPRAAGWMLPVVVACCLVSPLAAQERRSLDTQKALPLPLPIVQGARWLRDALLQPVQHATPDNTDDSQPLREMQSVQRRLGGSVIDGTFLAGDKAQDRAEQRHIWERYESERLASEATRTRRVSDDGETLPTETLPSLGQWPTPADPLQIAAEQLRASARNLDSLAADLEDAGKYKEADRLRSRAQQMRTDARSFVQPVETAVTR